MKLTPAAEKFIVHWGQMGSRWGINRTMAQIHSLLYITPRPLPADEITETLGVARSNVSTSLRELRSWGLIEVVQELGDRRDHFTSRTDVWEMFSRIIEERKRRELDPTLEILRECLATAKAEDDRYVEDRITELMTFLETMVDWYEHVRRLPRGVLEKLFRLGDRLQQIVSRAA